VIDLVRITLAHHEAGHVVGYYAGGLSIDGVEINPRGGHAAYSEGEGRGEGVLVGILAGDVAARAYCAQFGCAVPREFDPKHGVEVRDFCWVLSGGDVAAAIDTARVVDMAAEMYVRVSRRTDQLIEAQWPAVEAVARMLLRCEKVSGELATEIAAAYWIGQPEARWA
jgi:hypothetical protein